MEHLKWFHWSEGAWTVMVYEALMCRSSLMRTAWFCCLENYGRRWDTQGAELTVRNLPGPPASPTWLELNYSYWKLPGMQINIISGQNLVQFLLKSIVYPAVLSQIVPLFSHTLFHLLYWLMWFILLFWLLIMHSCLIHYCILIPQVSLCCLQYSYRHVPRAEWQLIK